MAMIKPDYHGTPQDLHQWFASAFDNSQDDAATGQMYAACISWRLGLSHAEQDKPEAVAALMGMFDAIARCNGLDREQAVICFREVLSVVYQRLSHEPVPAGLLQRMLATSDEPELSRWLLYGGLAIHDCLTGLDPVDTIAKLVDAVKIGKIG
jgi:hypothetical protein